MKRYLVLFVLMTISSLVFANDTSSQVNGVNSNAESTALNAGNSQSINFTSPANTTTTVVSTGGTDNRTDTHYSGSFKTVPNVYAPPVGVTAPCIVGWSAGVSVIGIGVSAGHGVEDGECTNRENARMLHAFGEVKGAVSLLCQNKNVYRAMQERCDLAIAREGVTVVSVAPQQVENVIIVEEPKRKHSRKKVTE